jgi:hypothetical protein
MTDLFKNDLTGCMYEVTSSCASSEIEDLGNAGRVLSNVSILPATRIVKRAEFWI